MKTSSRFILCFAVAFSIVAELHAQQSERLLTIKAAGFQQGSDAFGNDKAVPFRYTTKEVLNEIGFFKGMDLTNGVLLLIDSVNDTNAVSQVVVRKGTNQVDVTDLFTINQGEGIITSKFVANTLKSATIYSIDSFRFNTLSTDTNGLDLLMQLFSKESQRAVVKTIGLNRIEVISSSLSLDGNGDILDQFGLIAPLKGTVKIGAPKFVP